MYSSAKRNNIIKQFGKKGLLSLKQDVMISTNQVNQGYRDNTFCKNTDTNIDPIQTDPFKTITLRPNFQIFFIQAQSH